MEVEGGITPFELMAFKEQIKEGNILRCPRHKRKGDEEDCILKMQVIRKYPFVLILGYQGNGRWNKTSMTWAEAITLNRKKSEKLKKNLKEKEKGKLLRKERDREIIQMRKKGITYVEIARIVGIHSTTVRKICVRAVKK